MRGSLQDAGIECKVLPATANMEGPEAAQEIRAALSTLNDHPSKVDLIVIARGGANVTRLWAFNDWELAEAIVHSRAPVLTAIGHRQDETLADLVADARAHTPSLVGATLAKDRPVERDPIQAVDQPTAREVKPLEDLPRRGEAKPAEDQPTEHKAKLAEDQSAVRDVVPPKDQPKDRDVIGVSVLVSVVVVVLLFVARALGWL